MWGLMVAAGIAFIEKMEIAVFSKPYSCSLWEQLKTTVFLELPWAGAPCEAVDIVLMLRDGDFRRKGHMQVEHTPYFHFF